MNQSSINDPAEPIEQLTILIAEDDEISATVLAAMTKTLGYVPVITPDGSAAWDVFQTSGPQIVLTDWQMPIMSGIELCKKIRERQTTDYTYVIVLTATFTGKECYK